MQYLANSEKQTEFSLILLLSDAWQNWITEYEGWYAGHVERSEPSRNKWLCGAKTFIPLFTDKQHKSICQSEQKVDLCHHFKTGPFCKGDTIRIFLRSNSQPTKLLTCFKQVIFLYPLFAFFWHQHELAWTHWRESAKPHQQTGRTQLWPGWSIEPHYKVCGTSAFMLRPSLIGLKCNKIGMQSSPRGSKRKWCCRLKY